MKIFSLFIFSLLSFSDLALSMEDQMIILNQEEGAQGEKRKRQEEEKDLQGGDSRKEGPKHKKIKEDEIIPLSLEDLPSEMKEHIFSYVCADPQGVKAWIPLRGTAKWARNILRDEVFLNTQVFPFLSGKFLPLDDGEHKTNYKLRVFDLGKKVKRLRLLGDDRKVGEFYARMLGANDNKYFFHPYVMAQIFSLISLPTLFYGLPPQSTSYIYDKVGSVASILESSVRTKRKEGKESPPLEKAWYKLEFFLSAKGKARGNTIKNYDYRVSHVKGILREDALNAGPVNYAGEEPTEDLVNQLNKTEYPVWLFRFMAADFRIAHREKARRLLRYLADKGNKVDLYNYCDFCREAGVDKEIYKVYLHKAAEKGHKRAQYDLGLLYLKGREWIKKDEEKAVELFEKAAVQGHGGAQYALGLCYFQGWEDVEKDSQKALRWVAKAAEQGHAEAQYKVGVCYFNGVGVEKNDIKAFEWFTKAAEQGHAEAQYELGVCYSQGRGVEKDSRKAFGWVAKAAEQGYAGAQYELGLVYFNGLPLGQYDVKAFEWFAKAAAQGHAQAQYKLSVCYALGRGVEKNGPQAFQWVEEAAVQGYTLAQYLLSFCYFNGLGVEKNLEKAAAAVQPLSLETRKEHGIERHIQETDPFYEWVMGVPVKEASPQESREESEKEKEN
jgi:TPR repeat protein